MELEGWLKTLRKSKREKLSNFKNEVKQTDEMIKKLELLKNFKENPTMNKKGIGKLFSVLCFLSPAYCCGSNESKRGSGKVCPFRDSFWEAIGLTLKDFEEYKERSEELFWDFLKERGVI